MLITLTRGWTHSETKTRYRAGQMVSVDYDTALELIKAERAYKGEKKVEPKQAAKRIAKKKKK
jgi:hypothetical protein